MRFVKNVGRVVFNLLTTRSDDPWSGLDYRQNRW